MPSGSRVLTRRIAPGGFGRPLGRRVAGRARRSTPADTGPPVRTRSGGWRRKCCKVGIHADPEGQGELGGVPGSEQLAERAEVVAGEHRVAPPRVAADPIETVSIHVDRRQEAEERLAVPAVGESLDDDPLRALPDDQVATDAHDGPEPPGAVEESRRVHSINWAHRSSRVRTTQIGAGRLGARSPIRW